MAKPDLLKGTLMSASSDVDKQVSRIRVKTKNNKLDSLLTELRLVSTNKDYFEKTFKNAHRQMR